MKNIVTFINMDGYGFYLWPAFSLTILILLIMATIGLIKLKFKHEGKNCNFVFGYDFRVFNFPNIHL